MLQIDDTVRVIATKERLIEIGVPTEFVGQTGKISYIFRSSLPNVVKFHDEKCWSFREDDLLKLEYEIPIIEEAKIKYPYCSYCDYKIPDWGAVLANDENTLWTCPKCKNENPLPKSPIKNKQTEKPTNPKDALGIRKVPLHCVPCGPLFELGLAMMEGGRKYGTHNYRAIGVRASTYYDAAMRHLMSYWEGEDIDPDSGIHHVIKAIACLTVLRDSMIKGNCEDDRPIKNLNGVDMSKLNKAASDIIDRYSECAKPFLEKNNAEDN